MFDITCAMCVSCYQCCSRLENPKIQDVAYGDFHFILIQCDLWKCKSLLHFYFIKINYVKINIYFKGKEVI